MKPQKARDALAEPQLFSLSLPQREWTIIYNVINAHPLPISVGFVLAPILDKIGAFCAIETNIPPTPPEKKVSVT